ncbi:hypothetical protein LXL04_016089 [Taraxacum kok-saghyz]
MIRLQSSLFNTFRSKSIAFRRLSVFRATSSKKYSPKMAPPILSLALPSETGRVLSIQSHTVQGYVGNKSAVFPLQLLGYDVDPIMSVQFSNHTGYPTFRGQVLNGKQLWELIEGLEANNLLYYTHLSTGYFGSVSFLENVLEVVKKLRSINPSLTYVCDPVMGDEGKLYIFEVEQLTGSRIASEEDGREACRHLHAAGPSKVVITSMNHLRFPEDAMLSPEAKDLIYRLLCDVEHRLGTSGPDQIKLNPPTSGRTSSGPSRKQQLNPKDLNFVGYTYKNFDAVKALRDNPDLMRSASSDSLYGN